MVDFFYPEENSRLLASWLGYDPFASGSVDELPFRASHVLFYAVIRGERKFWGDPGRPLPAELHPAASRYWNLYLPDHCPGDGVVYPGAKRVSLGVDPETGREMVAYAPVALVACHHFEHGEYLDDLASLYHYAEILSAELYGHGMLGLAYLVLLDPPAEQLIMVVEPDDTLDYQEDDPAEWRVLKRTPEEALEAARRGLQGDT